MQGSLPIQSCIFDHYQVDITQINPQKLSIFVFDSKTSKDYSQETIQLKHIGVNTLVKALQRSKSELQASIFNCVEGLRIRVKVISLFLLPIEEEFTISNERSVTPTQSLKRMMKQLNVKAEAVLESQVKLPLYLGYSPGRKQMSSEDYATIVTIQLPPGNYLVTLSFFVKSDAKWVSLHLSEGDPFIASQGFFLSNSSQFMPITIRKKVKIPHEKQIRLMGYAQEEHYCTFLNAIVVARRLSES